MPPMSSIRNIRVALMNRNVGMINMNVLRRLLKQFALKSYKPVKIVLLTPAVKGQAHVLGQETPALKSRLIG